MQIWLVQIVDAETGQVSWLTGTPHAGRVGFSRRKREASAFEPDEAEDYKQFVEELLGRAVRVAVTA